MKAAFLTLALFALPLWGAMAATCDSFSASDCPAPQVKGGTQFNTGDLVADAATIECPGASCVDRQGHFDFGDVALCCQLPSCSGLLDGLAAGHDGHVDVYCDPDYYITSEYKTTGTFRHSTECCVNPTCADVLAMTGENMPSPYAGSGCHQRGSGSGYGSGSGSGGGGGGEDPSSVVPSNWPDTVGPLDNIGNPERVEFPAYVAEAVGPPRVVEGTCCAPMGSCLTHTCPADMVHIADAATTMCAAGAGSYCTSADDEETCCVKTDSSASGVYSNGWVTVAVAAAAAAGLLLKM